MRVLLEYEKLGNIRNLEEAELAQKINAGLDNYSPTDANKLIEAYCKAHFGDVWDNLSTMYLLIKENIEDNGVAGANDTKFWKFLNSAKANKINFEITPAQGQVLYNCISLSNLEFNNLDGTEPFLFDKNAYTSDSKLKSVIFVNDTRNVRKYGLTNDKQKPLTVDDILYIQDDKKLADVINGGQTKFPGAYVGNVYRMLTLDRNAPDIDINSDPEAKKSMMKAYLGDTRGADEALDVWNDIIDNGDKYLERITINDDDVVMDKNKDIDFKATLVKHLLSLSNKPSKNNKPSKSSDSTSYSEEAPLINALVSNFKDSFSKTKEERKISADELYKFALATLDNASDEKSADYSKLLRRAIRGNDRLKDEFIGSLRNFVRRNKVDTNSTKGELNNILLKFLYKFIADNVSVGK